MISISDICKILLETQHDSLKPKRFEVALSKAFNKLGFKARHIGGAHEPDVLVEVDNYKVILDGKTTKGKKIIEGAINFNAIEEHKKKHKAKDAAIIGVDFSGGRLLRIAKEKGIKLIKTEAICHALKNHDRYPYEPKDLANNLFRYPEVLVKARDIKFSIGGELMKKIENIVYLLKTLHNLKEKLPIGLDMLLVALNGQGIKIEESDLSLLLEELSKPPIIIIIKTNDNKYTLAVEINSEIVKKVKAITEALDKIELELTDEDLSLKEKSKRKDKTQKVTAGDFDHKGNGIFIYKNKKSVKIDAKKGVRTIANELKRQELWTKNLSSFYYRLRVLANLIGRKTRT